MQTVTDQEYAPYYQSYVARFLDKELLTSMSQQLCDVDALLSEKEESITDHRYAQGKWSVAELILHISDTERVFAYRALAIARGDRVALPGFEQDDYVANCRADHRTLKSLITEFKHIRKSTISLFESFDQDTLLILGNANGQSVSVRALGYILLGHCQHHMEVLSKKYFV